MQVQLRQRLAIAAKGYGKVSRRIDLPAHDQRLLGRSTRRGPKTTPDGKQAKGGEQKANMVKKPGASMGGCVPFTLRRARRGLFFASGLL
jgi:hypothetical protein